MQLTGCTTGANRVTLWMELQELDLLSKGLWSRVKEWRMLDLHLARNFRICTAKNTTYVVPENYIRTSLVNPQGHIVQGISWFDAVFPRPTQRQTNYRNHRDV